MPDAPPAVALSVVAAARNEQDNVARLVREIEAALSGAGLAHEIIVVDDGSTDGTAAALAALRAAHPRLRVLRLDGGQGQSAALHAGMQAAGGELVATLDADCQNDPADLVPMIGRLRQARADLVQGDRSASRRDGVVRRVSSAVARLFRRWLLRDPVRDTGCTLRVMRRDVARRLPLELRGLHRFVPHTARMLGYTVIEMPVRHRPRTAGRGKYGSGLGRAVPALVDCLGVRWMDRRRRDVSFEEIPP